MKQDFDKILNSGFFDDELRTSIKEAFENKLDEVKSSLRKEIEESVRKEYKEILKTENKSIVEAVNKTLTEAIGEYSTSLIEAEKELKAEKEKIVKDHIEDRKKYEDDLKEHISTFETFILENLKEAVDEQVSEAASLREARIKIIKEMSDFKVSQKAKLDEAISNLNDLTKESLQEKVKELEVEKANLIKESRARELETLKLRLSLKEQTQENINKFNLFAVEKLKEEIQEFQKDKNELNERRVQFEIEARTKLAEERTKFINVSKELVAETVYNALKTEMESIREDIKRSSENRFGRKIFEAFYKEFIFEKLADEKSEINKVNKELEAAKKQLEESKSLLAKQTFLVEKAERIAKSAKDESLRTKKMMELLGPLNKSSKELMESLLVNTKTEKLEESFNKLLPSVLKGDNKSSKTTLMETKTVNNARVITGDKTTRSNVNIASGQKLNEEREEVLRLAGLIKENNRS